MRVWANAAPWMARLSLVGFALSACAPPALTLYALGAAGGGPVDAPVMPPLRPGPVVIEIARVTLPDYLDTQDILLRRGSTLEASKTGRWASRLSLGATALLAARLAETRPDALVTTQSQSTTPTYRLLVEISRLDLEAGVAPTGRATLEADWLIVPRDASIPTTRDRVRLVSAGLVGSDQDLVALETALLSRLADAIDIRRLR